MKSQLKALQRNTLDKLQGLALYLAEVCIIFSTDPMVDLDLVMLYIYEAYSGLYVNMW